VVVDAEFNTFSQVAFDFRVTRGLLA